ncbi:Aminopeptidase P, N-terminal domain [Sphingobacterium spiritivorum]|uniref:Xaa-Pro aminopeptidase n=1 Tax=Sphingobacterium spiritivorum TaxID=258 RepID=A0A380CKV5_SPHSI|nr:aminopeptidase P N-terminal domain-containing protein [Sphingobacterium spiritivorum]SUJ22830.1 Aminopeptidase P, N-terminal domain [Sphingobacterium spiritivorum]
MFTAHTYQERRNVLKKNMDRGILLFLGNIENPVNFEHNPYRFRQDSTFLYYFGIQEPRLAAVIDIDEDKTIVFGDELSIDDIVWMGKQETLKEKCLRSGVTETRSFSALATYLQDNKKPYGTLSPSLSAFQQDLTDGIIRYFCICYPAFGTFYNSRRKAKRDQGGSGDQGNRGSYPCFYRNASADYATGQTGYPGI